MGGKFPLIRLTQTLNMTNFMTAYTPKASRALEKHRGNSYNQFLKIASKSRGGPLFCSLGKASHVVPLQFEERGKVGLGMEDLENPPGEQ